MEIHQKVISLIAWLVCGVYVLAALGFPLVYVETGSTAVVTTFGAVTGYLENGLHLVIPFAQEVHHIPTRLLTVTTQTSAPTIDLQEVEAKVSFQFSLVPAAAGGVFELIGDVSDVERVILDPGLQEELKAVTAKYQLDELLGQRDKVSHETREALETWVLNALRARGLDKVINVGSLQLSNLAYSQVFQDAVARKSEAQNKVPEAENTSKGIIAQAEAEAAEIMRQADADALTIRVNAEQEAKAMQEKAAQLKEHPELPCYLLYKKWNGELPAVTDGSNPLPFYDEACRGAK
ncbi:MAG TPA: prohibitin family protein [Candidatus Obscuribacterales bacterium]